MICVTSERLTDPAGTDGKRQDKEMFTIADIHNIGIQIERNKEEMGRKDLERLKECLNVL